MLWKRGIGYVNISKNDKERIKNDKSKGSFESKKKKERKDRVNKIVLKHFNPGITGLSQSSWLFARYYQV